MNCRGAETGSRMYRFLVCLAIWTVCSLAASEQAVADFYGKHASSSGHTNNWAVLVCASRYWFNYRVCPRNLQQHIDVIVPQHMANALGM